MRFRQHLLRTLLAVACAVTLPATAAFAAGTIQVTVDNLNVRSGPSTQDQVVTTLPIKTVLPVISEKGDWVNVRLPDGKTGWVANWLVTKSSTSAKPASQTGAQSTAPQVESTTDNLNVRSGPGQNYSVVEKINPGKNTRLRSAAANGSKFSCPQAPRAGSQAGSLLSTMPESQLNSFYHTSSWRKSANSAKPVWRLCRR